ncbi:hypothetical protein COP2_035363 [Malus domestica]
MHLLHVTSTCIRRALKWGHFSETPKLSSIQVPEESRKRSSFIVLPRSSPTAFGSTIIHLQDQAPTALEESVLRSLFIVLPRSSPTALGSTIVHLQDQAPTALEESTIVHHPFIQDQAPNGPLDQQRRQIHTSNRSSRSSPKALEDPFITVLQDQAQKPLEIRSSLFFQDQAPTALWINNVDKSTHPTVLQDQAQKPLKIRSSLFFKDQAQKLIEDPLKSTFKDQAHGPLKKLPTVHPRSSLDGPWTNETPINQHLTEIESEDQNRGRL